MRVGIWLAVGALAAVGGLDGGEPTGRAAPASIPAVDAPPEAVRMATERLREMAQPGPDGSLVIANSRYRAVFSASDGLVYTPRVDGRLEPRLTWAYRARTIGADTVTRRLDAVAPAVSATGEHVVDFGRAGLVERYEGEAAAVEQIFVLTERPGRGDVRIEGDVTFAGRVSAVGGGLRFEAPGLPGFSYAAPIAFDADDQPIPVRVETAGSRLSLVLDGAALDDARWPVTIDPLLGIADVDDTDNTTTAVDIAYDPRRGQFLVVYDAKPSVNDERTDIMLRRFYEDGNPVGPPVVLAEAGALVYHQTTYASWTSYAPGHHPRIACDDVIDRCLVVWQRDGVSSRIRALLISAAGTALGASFSPGPFAPDGFVPNQEQMPSVVARRMRAHAVEDPAFLVTWTEYNNAAIYAQFARVSGAGVPLGETHMSAPSVGPVDAAYDPFFDLFLAVWQGDGSVAARTVSPASGAGIPVSVTAEPGHDPQVTFDVASKRYLVAYTSAAQQLRGRFLASDTSPIGNPIDLTTPADYGDRWLSDVTAQNGTFLTTYFRVIAGEITHARMARFTQSVPGIEVPLAGPPKPTQFKQLATSNGGYVATVGVDDNSVKIFKAGRWATGMVQGDANDFDGDGLGDLYIYRPSTGTFFVRKSSIPSGSPLPQTVSFTFGGEGHVPVVLDWDGDTLADIGVFNLPTGRWTIRLSSTGANEIVALGHGGDVLVPGNYLGGIGDEIAVWRPLTGEWFIRERGSSMTTTVVWGQRGDQPVPADADNDGRRELCVFRQGTWMQVKLNLTGLTVRMHGQIGDVAFGGNFVGGPEADQAVYRGSTWHIKDGGTGAVTSSYMSGRVPVTLDWNGDGLLDVGSWNEGNGDWIISAAGATTTINYGATGDIPLGGQ
jgi:hypothetical protein